MLNIRRKVLFDYLQDTEPEAAIAYVIVNCVPLAVAGIFYLLTSAVRDLLLVIMGICILNISVILYATLLQLATRIVYKQIFFAMGVAVFLATRIVLSLAYFFHTGA